MLAMSEAYSIYASERGLRFAGRIDGDAVLDVRTRIGMIRPISRPCSCIGATPNPHRRRLSSERGKSPADLNKSH